DCIVSERDGHTPGCMLVIPLLSRRTVLGAVGLLGTSTQECTQVDLHLCQAIGAELGVALENARRYDEIKQLADRDPVTGLLSHRAIHQRLGQELKRTQRAGQQLSVIMTDLDGFKLFNDTHGHPVGDQVLRQVAAVLSENGRVSDVLGRYGGDEFVAILPETGTDGAIALAERIQSSLAQQPYAAPDGTVVPVHMSFGIATYPQDARQSHDLIGLADRNLYDSKQRGGDTITAGDCSGREDVAMVGTFGVLDGLVTAVDHKDHYTRRHSEHVTEYAVEIARKLGLPEESQHTLQVAGLLHDVGKIGVPDRILRKPARLLDEEFSIVKQHALLGEMIIKEVPNLTEVLAAVGSHHERVDGQGYPRGLKGGEIPLLGRILAVADAYSAMTTDRPYRQAMSPEQAKAELRRVADTQLDASIVDIFLSLLEDSSDKAIA
ncbi:MAG: diguanylate cyclase, partial [Chloroflexi bacterium]|nr:diguanylate cyclase [Chloroflexota bacterium]